MSLLRERTGPDLGIIEPCLPSPPPSGPGWLPEEDWGLLMAQQPNPKHVIGKGCADLPSSPADWKYQITPYSGWTSSLLHPSLGFRYTHYIAALQKAYSETTLHTANDVKVEGPYVHGDQFVVRFKMEVTPKGEQRMNLDEVGLYTVQNPILSRRLN